MTPAETAKRATDACARAWKQRGFAPPVIGFVLGSGLKALADRIGDARAFDPTKIAGFPKPTVKGHAARIVSGTLGGVPVAAFVGRIHAYEGHPLPIVGLTARFLVATGARVLVLTNAAGSLHRDWRPGDAVLISDHLNMLGGSPLDGVKDEDFGPRFCDMGDVWPAALRRLAARAAPRGIAVHEGVYAAFRGPQYETPAEVRMLRILGADVVGMSTVPEAIVAAQMKVPALGISLVTNLAAGVGAAPLSHEDVLEAGARASEPFASWLERLAPKLAAAASTRRSTR